MLGVHVANGSLIAIHVLDFVFFLCVFERLITRFPKLMNVDLANACIYPPRILGFGFVIIKFLLIYLAIFKLGFCYGEFIARYRFISWSSQFFQLSASSLYIISCELNILFCIISYGHSIMDASSWTSYLISTYGRRIKKI